MEIMDQLRGLRKRTKINTNYRYNLEGLLKKQMWFLKKKCNKILDIGKSSRHWYDIFDKGQITTLDINQFKDYPDIIDDLCNITKVDPSSYDGVICRAVLQCVYDPDTAVQNLHKILKKGGYYLGYEPYLLRYQASKDLKILDFFRFSRDGIAYLFRNFSKVIIYPVRGKYSTMINLHSKWKKEIERRFGQTFNRIIDIFFRNYNETDDVSGYNIWAVK